MSQSVDLNSSVRLVDLDEDGTVDHIVKADEEKRGVQILPPTTKDKTVIAAMRSWGITDVRGIHVRRLGEYINTLKMAGGVARQEFPVRTILSDDELKKLSTSELLEYVQGPFKNLSEKDYEAVIHNEPTLSPDKVALLPPDLQLLFEPDVYLGMGFHDSYGYRMSELIPAIGDTPIADLIIQHYGVSDPLRIKQIRQDIRKITAVFRDGVVFDLKNGIISCDRINSVRWALRSYIAYLEKGIVIGADRYLPLIKEGGIVAIRHTQKYIQSSPLYLSKTGFNESREEAWWLTTVRLYNRLHRQQLTAREAWLRAVEFVESNEKPVQ